jgi:predicted Kef-type K+ transport protein
MVMATTGALLAFGWHDGEPTKAFRNAGRMLLESPEFGRSVLPIVSTSVGFAHHLLVAVVWGVLLILLVRAFRGWTRVAVTIVVSLLFALLNLWLIPPAFGVGYAVVTSVGRALPLALSIAFALLVTPWASGVPEQRPSTSQTY